MSSRPGIAAILMIFALSACTRSYTLDPEPATGSTSSRLGPAGGTLTLGDLSLAVPPGALSTETRISVTATHQRPPDGFTAYTPVYRFEPAGLDFEAPVTVRLPFAGDEALATVFWTTRGSSSFTALPTRIEDGMAVAEVRHFSEAFVGTGCAGGDCCRRATGDLDVLLMVDDSNSMSEEQESLAEQLPRMARALATGDVDGDGTQDFPAVGELHVGVVSSDMGVGGFSVPTCHDADFGDDGVLLTSGNREIPGCEGTYPGTHVYDAEDPDADADAFAHDVGCVAAMGTGGCGFEQQLESALKALTPSTSDVRFYGDTTGHADGDNAGFLREGSVLAVVQITDEDDGSTQDADVFNPSSETHSGDLNLRRVMYPEAMLPTGRFVDGMLALRADPGALVHAVIAGVPVGLSSDDPDYDAILAAPEMEERIDPDNPTRLVPSCDVPGRGLAFPPRRLVETTRDLARAGAAGVVYSICTDDFSPAMNAILDRVGRRLAGACE